MIEFSIIIPFHRASIELEYCLGNLYPQLPKNCEVIVVGHFSNAEFELLNTTKNKPLEVLSLDRPHTYPQAINIGAEEAKGRYLIFLDSDTVPCKNWFQSLTSFYIEKRNRESVGIVSSKMISPKTGRIVDFGIGFTSYNAPHPFRGYRKDHPLTRQSYRAQAACSAAMMLEKEVFKNVGMLDTELPYSYCDIDLCLRIQELGLQTWLVSDAEIYHYNASSKSGKNFLKEDTKAMFSAKNHDRIQSDMLKYLLINWKYFLDRNSIEDEYFLIDLSTVIDRNWYQEILTKEFQLSVVDQITVSLQQRDNQYIDLYRLLTWGIVRKTLPLVFLVDSMLGLSQNDLWFRSRPLKNDLIVDRNGNVTKYEDL